MKTLITRSFSYKHNAGSYETRDFFCSQEVECEMEDAERTSELAYEFCKSQVIKSLNSWLEENKKPEVKVGEKLTVNKK